MTDFQAPNNSYEMMLAMLGGVNPKSVNTMQDLSSYLFNPQYGITGDTYESAYTLPEPYVPNTPRLDAYMNSANPIWRDVASGIQGGSLDEASAVAALYNGLGFEYDTQIKQGLSVSDLRSAVKEMFDEKERDMAARIEYDRNLLESERENVFGKAGLPQPYDQWSAETMPVSDDLKAFLSRLTSLQGEINTAKDKTNSAQELAKLRMLSKVTPSAKSQTSGIYFPNTEDQAKQLAKQIGVNEEWLVNSWEEVNTVSATAQEKQDMWKRKMENEIREMGSAVYDFGQDELEGRRAKKVLGITADKFEGEESPETKRENRLLLERASRQSVQDERQNVVNLQRKLLQNQAVAANRLLGEKIALGIQGRNPLEEALRRRALGLQGM